MKTVSSIALPGTLDPGFGEDGIVNLPFPDVPGFHVTDVLALPDKKVMVCLLREGNSNEYLMCRLHENGDFDESFAQGLGYAEITFRPGCAIHYFLAFKSLDDSGWLMSARYYSDSQAGRVLVRQRLDGQLDANFGEGGIRYIPQSEYLVDTKRSATALSAPSVHEESAHSNASSPIIRQMDGKIILVDFVFSEVDVTKSVVIRLNADASLDKSFNEKGFVLVEPTGISYDTIEAMGVAVQNDGKVLISGRYTRGELGNENAFITRYGADGKIDETFNAGEPVSIAKRSSLGSISVRESDGRIVAVGSWGNLDHGLIVVLNPNGSNNLVFNNGQPLVTDLAVHGHTWSKQSTGTDGAITVYGFGGANFGQNLTSVTARYRADGSLDQTFNGKGFNLYSGTGESQYLRGVSIMPDERIVIGGAAPEAGGGTGWVLRYLA